MAITGVGSRSSLAVQALGDMRAQLNELQRQLGTGKKSTTYGGLGIERGLAVGLRGRLSALEGYGDTMANVGVRLDLAQTALTRIATVGRTVKGVTQLSPFEIDATGQTMAQHAALSQLDEILGLLNTQAGDRTIFGGRAVDRPAVETMDRILNGSGAAAGLKQLIAERNQADLGASGLGRLVLPAITSSAASIVGAGATITSDAAATMTGTQNIGGAFTSAGGTLTINGTNIAINPGDNAAAILAAINAAPVVAATGVTATLNGSSQIVLTSANADTAINLTGTSAGILTELGVGVGPANPNNLLTQGAVTAGQTLTITIGANPALTITFGTNDLAVPPEVSRLAELNTRLATLTGGTASASLVNGNITITAGNTTDAITVGGTVTPATFGLGTTSALPSNVVGLSEDVAGHPFGFKLAAVSTNVTGAVTAGPAGAPALVSVNFRSMPTAGQNVQVTFNLPDGSVEKLTMTATTAATPGPNEFTIGATLAATSTNFQTALNTAVGKLAGTALAAASAMAAADNFFRVDVGQPPQRVAGPPFTTATTLVAGTTTNTVSWYLGEMGTDPARGTAVARADEALTVSYGMRANEQALRATVQHVAVFAAMTYSTTDPNAAGRFQALNARLGPALAVPPGQQRIEDIEAELAGAQTTFAQARERQAQARLTLQNLLQSIEEVPQEEVGAQILAMQTRLQASLQTTALLYRLSIVNYL